MKRLENILKKVEKPGRYIGNEFNTAQKDPGRVLSRFAFAFPDTYEIGMSYTGLQILYNILNNDEDIFCERVFAPAQDMEKIMREEGVPLFTLETKTPVSDMDFLGFTLQYEMSFSNVLNMLNLAGIPLLCQERNKARENGQKMPIIVAGGPCAYNPEPLADFIDVFLIGDGEELLLKFNQLYVKCKKENKSIHEFLREAIKLQGVYVPDFYEVKYKGKNDVINEFEVKPGIDAPFPVKRAIIPDLNLADYPVRPIVPIIETVHDRSVIETFRGCTRGCRFCQAGMIYRPVRERNKDNLIKLAKAQLENTGQDELSLLSLSTSDHSQFEPLVVELMSYCKEKDVSLSLPSLRLDTFSFKALDEIQKYKKSSLTFAVEAGTQRLRDVINKGITEEDVFQAVDKAIDLGWRNVKLYFMIGHPTETYEDLDGIADIANKIIQIKKEKNQGKLGKFNVTISVANFVPKAHTPFQWAPQDSPKEFEEKHNYLANKLHIKCIAFNYHDNLTSQLEAVFARGDRRLGKVILKAWELGCKFDGWSEYFRPDLWEKAFDLCEIEPAFYTQREREFNEVLPWDIIDSGIQKSFLQKEAEKSKEGETTKDCRLGCINCGMNKMTNCQIGGKNE